MTTHPSDDFYPSLSVDENTLLFSSYRSGNSDIWIKDLDNGNTTQITTDEAYDAKPSFSPDESKIIFHSDRSGNFDIWTIDVEGSDINQKYDIKIPNEMYLKGNYPNPFNPSTKISFELPGKSHVKLSIYDVTGKLIKTLLNDKTEGGYHSLIWDGKNDMDEAVASGIYFYEIQTEGTHQIKQMILLK